MFRSKEEIVSALIQGKTTVVNCRSQASKYRKQKRLPELMMFIQAIEEYKMHHKPLSESG